MSDKITKFIQSLNKKTRKRLKEKLIDIKNNPFGVSNIKKLQGLGSDAYRVRLGKIRIIYTVSGKSVEIIDIDYRWNIY